MRNFLTPSLILTCVFSFSCSQRENLEAIALNNKGVESLKNDRMAGAQEELVEALAKKPFEAAIHNNLGVAFDANKEVDKAIQSYQSATDMAKEDRTIFATRFNLAQGIAKQGRIDEALMWYQKALEVHPSSQEVKTNIELLTKQQSSSGGGQGQNQNKSEDQKDKNEDQSNNQENKDQQKKDPSKGYSENKKPQPKPFKGELSENDVKKILGELKQQEQRIRADYNRKEAKEAPRDKDW